MGVILKGCPRFFSQLTKRQGGLEFGDMGIALLLWVQIIIWLVFAAWLVGVLSDTPSLMPPIRQKPGSRAVEKRLAEIRKSGHVGSAKRSMGFPIDPSKHQKKEICTKCGKPSVSSLQSARSRWL